MSFPGYEVGSFYDEMFQSGQQPRAGSELLAQKIATIGLDELRRRQAAAERTLLQMGITFRVYGDASGTERIFPFDLIPRIVDALEWAKLERGLQQRIQALNLFLNDVYHEQRIVKDGVVPGDVISSAASFRPQCMGLNPPRGIWNHVTGTDLVRDSDGTMYVLEDNLRCPSGV